jgi:formylglycine-generating enzyme required for sulfatase activity
MPRAGILALLIIAAPPIYAADRPSGPLTAAEELALKPKDSFRECDVCPEMVVVPEGSFMMGSPPGEAGRERFNKGSESPQHRVTIARPFAVGKFETTFAEWDACVGDSGCKHHPSDQRWGRGRRPVINVSWDDAKEYVAWLSHKTGKSYRLVSEAEWEYAARAGTATKYHFGNTITMSQARFSESSFRGPTEGTVEVGSFPANSFGLYDMLGNVSEWVEDNWHPNYQGAPSDGSVWTGGNQSLRVVRGGDWYSISHGLRSAARSTERPGARYGGVGFRVARTL